MPNLNVWHVGNTNPSITQTVTAGGVVQDLSGASAKTFSMRALGTDTLTIDHAACSFVTNGTDGGLRYDWQASDVDTPGEYAVWWTVTISGRSQDVGEAIIEVRDHAPLSAYVELEHAKRTIEVSGTYLDTDLAAALVAGARAIDGICNRRFTLDADATQIRYYTPDSPAVLEIHDAAAITTLATDLTGDGTFETTWTANTDYLAEPLNAAADGEPYTHLRRHPNSSKRWPAGPRSVKVTGQFGWPSVPAVVSQANTILAGKLLKRAREAPFGIVSVGIDAGAAVRIGRTDPDVMMLLADVIREWRMVA